MYFLIDENADARVVGVVRAAGHSVDLATSLFAEGTPDEQLAAYADARGAVLVTADRDFTRLISRRPVGNVLRWKRAGRVLLSCPPHRGPGRLEQALPLLEWEYEHLAGSSDPRVIVELGGDVIRVER